MEQKPKFKLIKMTNAFRREASNRDIKVVDYDGETIDTLIAKNFPSDVEVVASINGKVIPFEEYSTTKLQHQDNLMLIPDIKGGGDKSILRVILMIAIMVVAWQVAPWLASGGGLFGISSTAFWSGAIMMVGGILVSTLLPDQIDLSTDDSSSKQAYSWNPRTTQQQGLVIPKYYGINKLCGNIIGSYIESNDEQQTINMLVCLGLGPVKSIYDVKINDQAYSLYRKFSMESRLGYLNQSVISNFSDTKTEVIYGDVVSNSLGTVTKVIDMSAYDDMEVEIEFSEGLWWANDDGGIDANCVRVRVEVEDDGTWVNLTKGSPASTVTVADDTWYVISTTGWRHAVEMGWSTSYEVTIHDTGSNDANAHTDGEFYGGLDGKLLYWYLGSTIKSFPRVVIYNHGEETDDATDFVGNSTNILRKTFFYKDATNVTGVRVIKVTPDRNDRRYGDTLNLSCIRKVERDDFSYPRHVLVGVKALATDQLYGSLNFSCMTEGAYVAVRSGEYTAGTVDIDTDYPTSIVGYSTTWVTSASVGDLIQIGNDRKTYSILKITDNTHLTIYPSYTGTSKWNQTYTIHNIALEASHNPAWVATDIITQPIIGPVKTGISNWAASTLYTVGSYVMSTKGYVTRYRCIREHTSGSSEPLWVSGINSTTQVDSLDTWVEESIILRFDGRDPSQLDYTSVKAWADFCATTVTNGNGGWEERCTFNGCFDNEDTLWESVIKVCQIGRVAPIWNGVKIGFTIDKEEDPVQLFSAGNIIQGTFKETFLSSEERASELEIQFMNKDKDYDRDQLNVFNTNINNPSNKVSVDLFGITSTSEAWRAGMYRLYQNELLHRTITFDADVDAIACTIGDVISVSHEVPQWGYGGKVVSATTNSVTIDRDVTVAAGSSYEIMIRLSDDTIVERTITNSAGTHTVLTVATPFSTLPIKHDPYTFGVLNTEAKLFRINNISMNSDQICTLSAIEYNADVYHCDTNEPVLPDNNYSALSKYAIPTNLRVAEYGRLDKSGTLTRGLNIKWDKPTNCMMKEAIVEVTRYNESSSFLSQWISTAANAITNVFQPGRTTQNQFYFEPVEPNLKYVVRVYGVNMAGIVSPYSSSPTYTVTNVSFYPSILFNDLVAEVTNLQLKDSPSTTTWAGSDVSFTWNGVDMGGTTITNIWLKDYKIDIKKADSTLLRTEYTKANEYTYTYAFNYADTLRSPVRDIIIDVTPRDVYGNETELTNSVITVTTTSLQVSNPAPAAPTDLVATGGMLSYSVNFTPSTEPDISGYLLFASQNPGFTPSTITLIKHSPDVPIIIESAATGTWCVKIAPYDTFGEDLLNYSSEITVTVIASDTYIADITPPNDPIGLSLSTWSDNALQTLQSYIKASWTTNTDADISSYNLQIRRSGDIDYRQDSTFDTQYTWEGLKPNTTYEVQVQATDTSNNLSNWCTAVTITSAYDNTAPATPTGMGATTNFPYVTIDWSDNSEADIAGYEFHTSTSISFTPSASTLYYKGAASNVTLVGTPGTTYYYRIRAFDWSNNYSGYTDQYQVTTALITTANLSNGIITTPKLMDFSIDSNKLAALAVTLGKLAANSITTSNIINGAITGAQIALGAISTSHLQNALITAAKILDGAITTSKIMNGAIGEAQIALAAISTTHLQNNLITAAKIIDGAITTSKIMSGAIGEAQIALGAISTTHLQNNLITAAKILAGSISTTHLQNNLITAAKILDGAISTSHLSNAIITNSKLADAAVDANKLAALAVEAGKIAAGAITTSNLQNGVITSIKIGDAAVGSAAIAAAAIGTAHIGTAIISTTHIMNGAIVNACIGNGAILNANIGAAAISTANIMNGAIQNAQIGNAAILSANIGAAAISTAHIINGAIQNAQIGNAAILNANIAAAAISTANIMNGAIVNACIGTGAILTANIGTAVISTSHIINGTIRSAQIGNAAILTANIANACISTSHIINGSIQNACIGNAAILTANIGTAVISTSHIISGAIQNACIGNAAILSANIASANISTTHIMNGAIHSAQIGNAAIGTAHIAAAVISSTHIMNAAINDAHINNLSAAKLTAGTIATGLINVSGDLRTTTTTTTQCIHLSATNNELYFYGNRGDGTNERLASIGINTVGADYVILNVGSSTSHRQGIASTSEDAYAITGTSGSSRGIYGVSTSSYGIYGKSTSGVGIYGTSASGDAAIQGVATSTCAYGVKGESAIGPGVYGTGSTYGVHGYTTTGSGVCGESTNASYYGVYGENLTGVAIYGHSHSNYGVKGTSIYSEGSTTLIGNVGIGVVPASCKLTISGAPVVDSPCSAMENIINSSTAYNASPISGTAWSTKYKSDGSIATMGGINVGKENTTDNDTDSYMALITRNASGGLTERIRITSDGYVGIGMTPGAYLLDVNASNPHKTGADAHWDITSDERIKTNIELADLDICYANVKATPLHRFEWAENVFTESQVKDRNCIGWIAQDIQKVFPKSVTPSPFVKKIPNGIEDYEEKSINEFGVEVVTTKTRDKFKEEIIEDCLSLNPGQLMAAHYGATQKLIQKIESLETKVAELEKLIGTLTKTTENI